jgi:rhamnosyltransferase subunit B
MHFIVTAIGSYGDVHPMVGLGARLAGRGHRVTVVTNPYFADVVTGAGLELYPLRTTDDYLRLINHPHIWHPTRSVPFVFREGVVNIMRDLRRALGELYVEGESIVAAHTLDVASRVFREETGARVALVTFSPQAMWSRFSPPVLGGVPSGPHLPRWWNEAAFWVGNRVMLDPALARPVNAWRRELGLPRVRRLFPDWWYVSDMNVCLFPEWFAPLQPDWPRPIEAVGFPLWDAGDRTLLPDEALQFLSEGSKPIVFTPGSANNQAKVFFETATEVCERIGQRGILLTKFAEQVPKRLPDSVRHFEFVPLTRLLPQSAAFVHHGGIGSSSQALAAGIPQLVRPLAFDQFDNAARIKRLGVGDQLTTRQFRTSRASRVLEQLLASETVAAKCQEFATRTETNGLDRACDLLERVTK